ncbi:hypothetical protein [Kitasatospora sp. NPDC091207]|uniref:hypothetical protein n=1 Tax=Kitasatospora sp. NPDC091207 TaxID=3364083 RepID=UPI0037F4DE3C
MTEVAPASVRTRARLVVAAHSHDREDCRALLQALGLDREDAETPDTGQDTARICVRCGRAYHHPGVRRRDRFCSTRCYRSSGETPGTAEATADQESPVSRPTDPLPPVALGPPGSGHPQGH